MHKKLGKQEVIVDGKPVVFDLDKDFEIDDLDEGMRTTPAMIAYTGSLHAAAKEEEMMISGDYRSWKAKRIAEALLDDPKAAQWKIIANIEASDEFFQVKRKQAKAAFNVELLHWIVESYRVKASLLQSLGAKDRAAFGATDMSTPEHPRRPFVTDDEKAAQDVERRDNVREKIKRGRAQAE